MWKSTGLRGKRGPGQTGCGSPGDASCTAEGFSRPSTERRRPAESGYEIARGRPEKKPAATIMDRYRLPISCCWLRAALLSAARRGSAVADADPAVDRLHVNRGAAVSEVGVETVLDLTLNRDREVHRDAAIHRRRFQMRGVVGRHAQVDAAV